MRRTPRPGGPERQARLALRAVDDRLGAANFLRRTFNKVFPDHWSFMLGEIALYSFIILLLTGTYLALFFNDSQREVLYNGSYVPLRGLSMSEAYASTLHISLDVRAGLLIRQIHHWAALLFVAAIVVHLCRIYFTGAFRKPREINWLIGIALLTLALLEGFAGYSLPDDLLSGTGIRIAYSIILSIPIVGTYLGFFVFGGNFPGDSFIPRLYIAHVFIIPALLAGLIGAHLAILWHQKHTDFAGPGKSEDTVVGTRLWPGYALKGQGYFFLVFAVLALLGAYVQINPIWLYGPYNPAQVSAGSQPDWYVGFLEGALRIMPAAQTTFLGHSIAWSVLVPAILLPGVLFTLMALYPFLEARFTGDHGYHNLLDRPRDRPVRTAIGAMSLTFYAVLWAAGGNDIIADTFHLSLQATTWAFRVLVIVLPPLAFYFARRWALGLQIADEHLLEHGIETGTVRRLPSGEYIEVTRPLPEQRRALIVGARPGPHAVSGDGHAESARAAVRGEGTLPAEGGGLVATTQRAIANFFFERRTRAQDEEEPEPPQRLSRPE
jgi:ubiquinol-cytochrome c reductase cytochrome b subunit